MEIRDSSENADFLYKNTDVQYNTQIFYIKTHIFYIKTKIFYIVHISSELAYVKKIPNKKSSPRKRHDHGTTNTIDEQ